jgi:hypothetical protein
VVERKVLVMRHIGLCALGIMMLLPATVPLAAQTPARDPSARLREVLPAAVAERVLATIAAARGRDLPAAALEHRALKFAARGIDPAAIEQSVTEHAERLSSAKRALETARGRRADSDELEAGAEVLRKGLSGADLSELAKAAPSGRSLALPLYALGSLLDRGLPSDDAIRRVHERLAARAADADFQNMAAEPDPAAAGQAHRPGLTGTDRAATRRPATTPAGRGTAGPPANVPANAGKKARPIPGKPPIPPGRGRGGG